MRSSNHTARFANGQNAPSAPPTLSSLDTILARFDEDIRRSSAMRREVKRVLTTVAAAAGLLALAAALGPPAHSQTAGAVLTYESELKDYQSTVSFLYFGVGCQIVSEVDVIPFLMTVGRQLDQDAASAGRPPAGGKGTRAAALAGRDRAAQPGACGFFQTHPRAAAMLRSFVQ